jgi:hypothetical protein
MADWRSSTDMKTPDTEAFMLELSASYPMVSYPTPLLFPEDDHAGEDDPSPSSEDDSERSDGGAEEQFDELIFSALLSSP